MIVMQAYRKGLEITLLAGGNLPEFVYSDEGRLQQVLLCLLMNAIKYTPKGSVTIRVTKDPNEAQMIMFQISDTGIGMPLDKKVQLFKLFGGDSDATASSDNTQRSKIACLWQE